VKNIWNTREWDSSCRAGTRVAGMDNTSAASDKPSRVGTQGVKARTLRLKHNRRHGGFTLTEVAVAAGGLGILTLVVATLLAHTVDTFGRVSNETYTTAQVRNCLEMISAEMRESVNYSVVNPAAGAPQASVRDALLSTSARWSDGTFSLDANGFPLPQSIVLFYLNTCPDGTMELMRHQLYYAEDLNTYAPPFLLVDPPYIGGDVVIIDSIGAEIHVDRTTGAVETIVPLKPPRRVINRVSSLDIVDNGVDPIEVRITCQLVDRKGRMRTSSLTKQIVARNL